MIARGLMLGAEQPVILHMLDIPPAAEALNGVKMELVDAAFPLLKCFHLQVSGHYIQNFLLDKVILHFIQHCKVSSALSGASSAVDHIRGPVTDFISALCKQFYFY